MLSEEDNNLIFDNITLSPAYGVCVQSIIEALEEQVVFEDLSLDLFEFMSGEDAEKKERLKIGSILLY